MFTRVYLFTGFLDSGKSTFINLTLIEDGFAENERTLLLVSEEGEVAYDEKKLNSLNVFIKTIDLRKDLNKDYLNDLNEQYHPTQVMIEVNGMENADDVYQNELIDNWEIVQVLTTVNAQTLNIYINNMRSLFYNHVLHSDLVIINRITDSDKKSFLRNNIKTINPNCQIIYENEDGSVNTLQDDELPFDLNASHLNILDSDFGLFCMDTLDHPQKYNNKHITIRGKYIGQDKILEDGFVLGRYAMVCCENDMKLVGLVCVFEASGKLIPDDWVEVSGLIKNTYDEDVKQEVCILYCDSLKIIKPLKNEYVTFD